jgi:hypothetical protein
MARFLAALLAVTAALYLAHSAIAQIFNPPRPPGNIPNRPDMPPTQTLPPGPPPGEFRPPGEIQSQPLPPPPSAKPSPPTAQPPQTMPAQPPSQAQGQTPPTPPAQAPPGQSPPGQPPNVAGPAPSEEPVTEPPTPKIANPTAVFSGLDKITGRIITFDVAIDETVRFGALEVTPRACYTRPPTELPQTDGFVEVDELTLKGELKRIFTGWMFAASPGLNAVEHPIYDVWLTDCKGGGPPAVTVEGPPEPPPPQRTPPRPRPPARSQAPPR